MPTVFLRIMLLQRAPLWSRVGLLCARAPRKGRRARRRLCRQDIFSEIEFVCVIIFTADYLIRLSTCSSGEKPKQICVFLLVSVAHGRQTHARPTCRSGGSR